MLLCVRHHDDISEFDEIKMDLEETQRPKPEQELGRIFGGEGDVLEEHEVAEREKSALEILEVCVLRTPR